MHPKLTVAQVKDGIVRGADDKPQGGKSIKLMNPKATFALFETAKP